jgi:hypothetical protein
MLSPSATAPEDTDIVDAARNLARCYAPGAPRARRAGGHLRAYHMPCCAETFTGVLRQRCNDGCSNFGFRHIGRRLVHDARQLGRNEGRCRNDNCDKT